MAIDVKLGESPRLFTILCLVLIALILWGLRVFVLTPVSITTGMLFLVLALCVPLAIFLPRTVASTYAIVFAYVSFTDQKPLILIFGAFMILALLSAFGRKIEVLVFGIFITVVGFYSPNERRFVVDVEASVLCAFLLTCAYAIGMAIARRSQQKRQDRQKIIEQREQLAIFLHDTVAADLTSVIVKLEQLAIVEPRCAVELQYCAATARRAILNIRELLQQLRLSEAIDNTPTAHGLATVVHNAVKNLDMQGFAVETNVEISGQPPSRVVNQTLEYCVGEAITNIVKYATPRSEVRTRVATDNRHIYVELSNSSPVHISRDNSTGYGLELMSARLKAVNGTLRVRKKLNKWTVIFKV